MFLTQLYQIQIFLRLVTGVMTPFEPQTENLCFGLFIRNHTFLTSYIQVYIFNTFEILVPVRRKSLINYYYFLIKHIFFLSYFKSFLRYIVLKWLNTICFKKKIPFPRPHVVRSLWCLSHHRALPSLQRSYDNVRFFENHPCSNKPLSTEDLPLATALVCMH